MKQNGCNEPVNLIGGQSSGNVLVLKMRAYMKY